MTPPEKIFFFQEVSWKLALNNFWGGQELIFARTSLFIDLSEPCL